MSLKTLLPRRTRLLLPSNGPLLPRRPFFSSLPSLPSLLSGVTGGPSGSGRTTSGGGPEGDEHHYIEEKILPYTPRELYSVVANVPSYSTFVPFCTASTVLPPRSSSPTSSRVYESKISPDQPFDVEAELRIGFTAFSEGYISQVKGRPFDSVEAIASSTPLFKTLVTTWTFRPASPISPTPTSLLPADMGPTLVTLDLRWSFNSQSHALASGVFFGTASGMMVRAFEGRVRGLYGDRS